MSRPHTQIDNEYGHNGYNLWVTSDKHIEDGTGDGGLWTVEDMRVRIFG